MYRKAAPAMPIKIYASELANSSTTEHRYGLVNRPPSIGSVPKGYNAYDPDNQGLEELGY